MLHRLGKLFKLLVSLKGSLLVMNHCCTHTTSSWNDKSKKWKAKDEPWTKKCWKSWSKIKVMLLILFTFMVMSTMNFSFQDKQWIVPLCGCDGMLLYQENMPTHSSAIVHGFFTCNLIKCRTSSILTRPSVISFCVQNVK